MAKAVSINELEKRYEDKVVLKDLSLEVPEGSIFGLIGPNGAGKSTLIGVLTGLLSYEGGDIEISGLELSSENELEIKRKFLRYFNRRYFLSNSPVLSLSNTCARFMKSAKMASSKRHIR